MKIARIVTLLSLPAFGVALLGCSSSSETGTGNQGPQNPGLVGEGEGSASAADTNPDGIPYPTENIGTNPRIETKPGNRIQNYKFLGYPDGDKSKGLQPMSLANFYDPKGERYRLIHVQAAGSWCRFCQEEVEIVTPLKDKLASRKVVWLISLAEGPTPGTASTRNDLDRWIAQFKAPFPHVLDSGNKNFGPFYDAAALPWNADINARTMEILSSSVSASGYLTETDILTTFDSWLKKIDSGEIK